MPNGVPFTTNFLTQYTLNETICATTCAPIQSSFTGWKTTTANTNPYIAGGNKFSGAIKSDGTLWMWGFNTAGQLGINSCIRQSSPVQTIAGGSNWCQISTSSNYYSTAAVKTDGTLWLWGCNRYGKFGNGSSVNQSSPVQTLSGGTNWKSVSIASTHTAAIKTDGTLWLWGQNNTGQLGNGTNVNATSPVQTITGGNTWQSVCAACFNTAAIKTDGTLWTWGFNRCGILGDNTITYRSSPVQTVAGGNNWKNLSKIDGVTLATKTDGTLWTWGLNYNGQLGDNSTVCRSSPVQTIAGGTNWQKVFGGSSFAVGALKTDGTLWVWGRNFVGTLGNGNSTDQSSPVQTVVGGTNWNSATTFVDGLFAMKNDGIISFTGCTAKGIGTILGTPTVCGDIANQLVEKDYLISVYPNLVPQQKASTLWLKGSNCFGKLGINNSSIVSASSPIQTIAGGTNWMDLEITDCAVAGIKTDGTLWLWGVNSCGSLGNNNTVTQSSPVQTIAGGTNWKQFSFGACAGVQSHSAAIKTDGTLWTWGYNSSGELGTNGTVARSSPGQTISSGNDWKQVSAGSRFTTAIKNDGTLWSWGRGYILGQGSVTNRLSPVQTASGGNNWRFVSAGQAQVAAIKNDGTLWMWGNNYYGVLGNNSTTTQSVFVSSPIQTVAGGTNWKQVATSCAKTVGLKTDGTVWVWGCDTGAGNRSSPIQTLAGGSNWKCFSTSRTRLGYSMAVVLTDGSAIINYPCCAGISCTAFYGAGGQSVKKVSVSYNSLSSTSGFIKEEGNW